MIRFFTAALFIGAMGFNSYAQQDCRDAQTIISNVADEPCEALEASAVTCFKSLNYEFNDLIRERESTSQKTVSRTEHLKTSYSNGLATLEDYLPILKGVNDACLDQMGAVDVVIEELTRDYIELDSWSKQKKRTISNAGDPLIK